MTSSLIWLTPSLISLVCSTTFSNWKILPEQEDVCANSFVMDLSASTKPYGKWENLPCEMRETVFAHHTVHIHLVHYNNKDNSLDHRYAGFCTFVQMFIQYICHVVQLLFPLQKYAALIQLWYFLLCCLLYSHVVLYIPYLFLWHLLFTWCLGRGPKSSQHGPKPIKIRPFKIIRHISRVGSVQLLTFLNWYLASP